MANLDFYAVGQDITDVLKFIFTETDCKLFESYSEYDKELREFNSISETLEAYNSKTVGDFLLQLWSPSVASRFVVKPMILEPEKCSGATFRFKAESWALMQLYFGRIQDNIISHSHFGHNSEKRARLWENIYFNELGSVSDCDWQQLKKISSKIQYHIRKRLAVSKASSRLILDKAHKKHLEGSRLQFFTIQDAVWKCTVSGC